MSRCARERRVFFIQEPEPTDGRPYVQVERHPSGPVIVTPRLTAGLDTKAANDTLRGLLDEFFAAEVGRYILWYYTPMALEFSRHLKPALTVYDCMDQLSAFKGAPARLQELEAELLSRADLVFTGGKTLYETKRREHDNVHLFPSGIDVEHFARARRKQADPVDQADIPHPRLGFFGVIDERMDLGLIEELARLRPAWHIIMLGPLAKIRAESLPRLPNTHYLGMKSYDELPAYLANWDVALLPFALNESTRFVSPTKIPEYLAGGKPVVSTPVQDVVNPYGEQGLVSIAATAADFVQAIERMLRTERKDTARWLEKVDAQLSQNSWDYTWKRMMTLIESSLASKRATGDAGEPDGAGSPDGSIPSIPVALDVKQPMRGPDGADRRRPFDYLIVGAGFAGSVLAERLARGSGKRVLIIDWRAHIAGNAYDFYNSDGIQVHKYGPHIFHTNSEEVFRYLSRFTDWRAYEHRVLASVEGQLLPFPINLDTINALYGLSLSVLDVEDFLNRIAEPRDRIVTSEDVVVSKVGRGLYEKFFQNYTRKQWDYDPSDLDASVISRVPIRYNRDDRYFTDIYQVMPLNGYTSLFEQLLDHPDIKIMLNTDYQEVMDLIPHREVIFTGPIDEYFDFVYGKLPYRSLDFRLQTLNEERHQPAAVINYPNEYPYTRVTEFKQLTGQAHPRTTLAYEYPTMDGDPYYPIPRPENAELYGRYQALAARKRGVYFAGRLGTYKYYNMDQVVAQALTLYARIEGLERGKATTSHSLRSVPVSIPRTGGTADNE